MQVYRKRVFWLFFELTVQSCFLLNSQKFCAGFQALSPYQIRGDEAVKFYVSGQHRQIFIGDCFLPGIFFAANQLNKESFFSPDCSVFFFFRNLKCILVNILYEYVSGRETVCSVLFFENKSPFWRKY